MLRSETTVQVDTAKRNTEMTRRGDAASATIARAEGRVPDTLRLSLDEFSHYFDSPGASVGLVRLRVTLVRSGTDDQKANAAAALARLANGHAANGLSKEAYGGVGKPAVLL